MINKIKFTKKTALIILAVFSLFVIGLSIYLLLIQIKFDIWISELNQNPYTPNLDSFNPIIIVSLFLMLFFIQINNLKKEFIFILLLASAIFTASYFINILPDNKTILSARYYYFIKELKQDDNVLKSANEYKEVIKGAEKLDPYILFKYLYNEKTMIIKNKSWKKTEAL